MRQTKVKAVIFDCDGVLVDSEHSHYLSWVHALQQHGHGLSLEEYHHYVGNAGLDTAKLLAEKTGIDCAEELLKSKRAHYQELQAQGIPPIQSTIDFVRLLAKEKEQRGIRLGVASAAKKKEVLLNLRHQEIEKIFDVVLSGQDDLNEYLDPEGVNKPKPYIYLHAAKMLNVSPKECIVIEDSRPGVSAGVGAGCMTIAVPNRFTRKHDLSHAALLLDSFAGIDLDHFFRLFDDC
ncbi:MAG: HAD family phosphatase [Verrucomicrobia bacterium]|nr:HAD family phosphatase [Verrucomicrobiota bacterium]